VRHDYPHIDFFFGGSGRSCIRCTRASKRSIVFASIDGGLSRFLFARAISESITLSS
jgi:hypothetical protein